MKIIEENKDFIIVEKPSGLLTHPDRKSKDPTLADLLIKKFPELKDVGDPERRGIVHRLDRDTSGIMVIARTPEMFAHLKKAFLNRRIKKEYTALLLGELPKDEGVIDFVIARSRRGGRMAARPVSQEGRSARTTYSVIKRFTNNTLVSAMPETGRTHQIRAHFHALGYPIVGDPLYKTKKQHRKELQKKEASPRLMLHASKITFKDLAGVKQTYNSKLPEEFADYIKTLKQKTN